MNIFDDELGQAGAQKSMSNYGENMRKKVFKVKKLENIKLCKI